MFNKEIGMLIGGVFIVGVAWACIKVVQIADKVGMTIDELSKKTSVDIEHSIIDQAVQKAVNREVGPAVVRTSNAAVRDISDDIKSQVRKSVHEAYSNVDKLVSDEILRQVANLDIERLKGKVASQAKNDVLKKLDGQLDGVVKDFKNNLDNIAKIYSALGSSMVQKPVATDTVYKLFKLE